jgi:hypothetical protein
VTQPRDVTVAGVRADLLRAIQTAARATIGTVTSVETAQGWAKAARNLAEAHALLELP